MAMRVAVVDAHADTDLAADNSPTQVTDMQQLRTWHPFLSVDWSRTSNGLTAARLYRPLCQLMAPQQVVAAVQRRRCERAAHVLARAGCGVTYCCPAQRLKSGRFNGRKKCVCASQVGPAACALNSRVKIKIALQILLHVGLCGCPTSGKVILCIIRSLSYQVYLSQKSTSLLHDEWRMMISGRSAA